MNTNFDNLINSFTFENYYSKEDVGYRLPNDLSLETFWQSLSQSRKQKSQVFSFTDQNKDLFWYLLTPALQKKIYKIDSQGKDSLYRMVKKEIEVELLKDSLLEEALYSSVIEGAFSTYKRLKELVDDKAPPADINDQMVLNNYEAMQFILKEKHRDLTLDFVLELHKIVTQKTLGPDEAYAGRFRDDWVYIKDKRDRVIYTPPPADQVVASIEQLIAWVNARDESTFIHPIVKASFIHFYLVYVHPFFDGNGRTARALFYYYLIKNGYEFFKYFSISVVVQKTKAQYYRAIKDVEDCGADMTYFLLYMAQTINDSIGLVTDRIVKHYKKDFILDKLKEKGEFLNPRQEKFLKKFLVSDKGLMTIKDYQRVTGVVYETARVDLEDLALRNILIKTKERRKFIYQPNYEF